MALGVAVVFATTALIRPQLLHYLNRAWLALGHLMHRVMSPLVMGIIFFSVSRRLHGLCAGVATTCWHSSGGTI